MVLVHGPALITFVKPIRRNIAAAIVLRVPEAQQSTMGFVRSRRAAPCFSSLSMLHGMTSLPFWLALAGIATAWFLYMKRTDLPKRIAMALQTSPC